MFFIWHNLIVGRRIERFHLKLRKGPFVSIHDPSACLDLSWHDGYLLLHVFKLLLQKISLLGFIEVQATSNWACGAHKLIGVVGGDRGGRTGNQIGLVVKVLIRDISWEHDHRFLDLYLVSLYFKGFLLDVRVERRVRLSLDPLIDIGIVRSFLVCIRNLLL